MLVEVAVIEVRDRRSVSWVAVVIVTPFVGHEAVRMLLQVLPDFGMLRQVLVETRMSGEELRIVRERRIGAQLMRHFGMLVEVAVVEVADGTGECRSANRSDEGQRRQSC